MDKCGSLNIEYVVLIMPRCACLYSKYNSAFNQPRNAINNNTESVSCIDSFGIIWRVHHFQLCMCWLLKLLYLLLLFGMQNSYRIAWRTTCVTLWFSYSFSFFLLFPLTKATNILDYFSFLVDAKFFFIFQFQSHNKLPIWKVGRKKKTLECVEKVFGISIFFLCSSSICHLKFSH